MTRRGALSRTLGSSGRHRRTPRRDPAHPRRGSDPEGRPVACPPSRPELGTAPMVIQHTRSGGHVTLRRGLGVLLGAVLSWALVAACTTAETKTGADPSPSATSSTTPAGPVTITLAVYGPEAMLKAYDDL